MKIFDLVKQFTSEMAHYVKNGMPNVSAEEYQKRLEVCNACPHKKENTCGCVIALKAKMATTTCPDDPPRWPEISEDQKELRKKRLEEYAQQVIAAHEKDQKIVEELGTKLPPAEIMNQNKFQKAKDKINKYTSSQKQKKK